MTVFRPAARATITQSLNAMELVKQGNVDTLNAAGMATAAVAYVAITDNAIAVMLELTAAVRAALDGDLEPARTAMRDLRLDQVEIR